MAEVCETIELDRDADEIWALVCDFVGFLAAIGIPASDDSDGSQTRRRVSSPSGDIVERLDRIDEVSRELSYSIVVPGPMPVTGYTGKIAVELIADRVCRIVWTASFTTTTGEDDSVARTIGASFRRALAELEIPVP